MSLGTDDLQTAGSLCVIVKLDIRSSTGHIGGDRYGTVLSGLCNNLSLKFMELCIQYRMLDTFALQHTADQLRSLDRDGTNQNRLPLLMCFLNFLYNSLKFLFLGLIYGILMIDTGDWTVRRDLDYVHSIDITELFLLGQRGTGHTCLLIKFIEEVLECDRRKGLALTLYLHMLLRLDCLM